MARNHLPGVVNLQTSQKIVRCRARKPESRGDTRLTPRDASVSNEEAGEPKRVVAEVVEEGGEMQVL